MTSIKKKFISGVLWESIGRFSALGIQFLVTIIIARALLPSDFGVVGLLTVFIALGQILLDSGFSQALIQKKDANETDLSSVYFLNMFVGFILYFVLFFISPYISSFYDIPELTNYARVLFLIIPINSFGLVQNVIIQKELDFRKTATANIVSAVLSGIIGISMAYSGFGIWALVGQQLSVHTVRTLLYIAQRRWLPSFVLSIKTIKDMFAFSMNLMFHSIVNVTMKNIYVLVIGKFYPVSQVGYYDQANKMQEISASTISEVVMKVSFPALVQKRDDINFLRLAYSKIFTTTIFLIVPLMVFLMCIAESLFRVLLTEKWLPAVPYFRILCLYGMVLPMIQISYNLYKLFKKGKVLLWIDTFRHLIVLASIVVTIKYGIDYMLISLVICTFLMALVNLYKSGSLISWGLSEQIRCLVPTYLIAITVGVIVSFIPNFESDLFTIAFRGCVFLIVFICGSRAFRLDGYYEVFAIVQSLKNKIK
ncbi:lipopolysaccharide biosynthesis protein [Myroides albus]|uniref:lipopolysaccharide biosynthesis protein n=1 Tax=Myroides albus TaxID=2562892 RepID=UPI0021590F3D|nr:lipopolysaccharide biosynthesis protein [Myroides albus]UVD79131.1 lipopolysaccharide biosynthesis protein [Myroides albus]